MRSLEVQATLSTALLNPNPSTRADILVRRILTYLVNFMIEVNELSGTAVLSLGALADRLWDTLGWFLGSYLALLPMHFMLVMHCVLDIRLRMYTSSRSLLILVLEWSLCHRSVLVISMLWAWSNQAEGRMRPLEVQATMSSAL